MSTAEPEAKDGPARDTATKTPVRRRRGRATTSIWARNLHSWTSMLCMLLILFFAVTGLTLSHPDWGSDEQTSTATGTLPTVTIEADNVDYLAISEYLRSTEGVTGTAGDHGVDGTEGRIAWSGPSYEASVFFDTESGDYTLTETTYGRLAWLNDLHKGRNTSTAWSWVLDASAIFLAFVALSGLVLQLLIQRRRRTALVLLGVGTVLSIVAFFLA